MFRITFVTAPLALLAGITFSAATCPAVYAQSLDTPMTRLRPIGAPSAVDQYRPPVEQRLVRETAYQASAYHTPASSVFQPVVQPTSGATAYPVRQAVMMQQQFDAPTLPEGGVTVPNTTGGFGGGMALPGNTAPPMTTAPPATTTLPGNLAPVPLDSTTINSSSDFAPMAQPQLGSGYATIDNCNCITAPSSYIAASASPGCAPVGYEGPVGYQPVGGSFTAPPVATGPAILPGGFARPRDGIPSGPLVTFGQQLNPIQVGQGILGQPVAYVPGQPIRNWIRYFFP